MGNGAPTQGPKIWNIDYALIRFNEDVGSELDELSGSIRANNNSILRKYGHGKAVHVVDQEAMRLLFERTKSDKIWSKIDCVQTNIRSQLGCGTPISVNFFAPINETNPEKTIIYDFRSLGDDEDLVK